MFHPDNLQSQPSVQYLAWPTAELELFITGYRIQDIFGLDHQPLLITLASIPPPAESTGHLNYRKANWELIETTIKDDQMLKKVSTSLQIKELWDKTINEITPPITRRV